MLIAKIRWHFWYIVSLYLVCYQQAISVSITLENTQIIIYRQIYTLRILHLLTRILNPPKIMAARIMFCTA